MAEPQGCGAEGFLSDLPARQLRLANGDSLRVALHGGHMLSWVAGGHERLYLSPLSRTDGRSAIRGGVPVCFPQFNLRGSLPKHGFARNLPWRAGTLLQSAPDTASLSLYLEADEQTRAIWPHSFELELGLRLSPGHLCMTLKVHNGGEEPLAFTVALHTYLQVRDIAMARLSGLRGQAEWDALTGRHGLAEEGLRFAGEFDRVYRAAPAGLLLDDGTNRTGIEQSASLSDTVVWNPGPGKCAALGDMPEDGYRHMLCVEAAQVAQAVQLPAGADWHGWQALTVL